MTIFGSISKGPPRVACLDARCTSIAVDWTRRGEMEVLQRNSRRRGWRMRGHVRRRGALTRLLSPCNSRLQGTGAPDKLPKHPQPGIGRDWQGLSTRHTDGHDHLPDLGVTPPTWAGLRSKRPSWLIMTGNVGDDRKIIRLHLFVNIHRAAHSTARSMF
jgi:hypothetical protein